MIIETKASITLDEVNAVCAQLEARYVKQSEGFLIITPSKVKSLDGIDPRHINRSVILDNDIQLASRKYQEKTREISIGEVSIGGETENTLLISGPCSVESEAQVDAVARCLVENDVKVLRAGCFKPRTSPYTFQGLGDEGLRILAKIRSKYNLSIITEVKDSSHVNAVIETSDIIQIGAKAMYDHAILRACGNTRKPVLIKRGFGSTLKEFVQAAEFVLSQGNGNVMLCERGIRTFETATRFTLDLCGVAWLKEHTNLPVIVDPSHAIGYRYGVSNLSRASVAMGIDGLLVEAHPNPEDALSDASQQISLTEIPTLKSQISAVAEAIGKKII